MTDIVFSKTRSRIMSGIRGENTKPQRIVRKGLFKRGFRFRFHVKSLQGKPNLVFAKHNAVIGCFWHHHDCKLFKWPKSNIDFWLKKSLKTRARRTKRRYTMKDGWRIFIVWECALKGKTNQEINEVLDKRSNWLSTDSKIGEISESSFNGIKTGNI